MALTSSKNAGNKLLWMARGLNGLGCISKSSNSAKGLFMDNDAVEAKEIEAAYIDSVLLDIAELKKKLVSQIAHNFRTPLTSVLGFAEMLLDDRPLTNEQRVEYARFIQYEGIRLSKLIDDVLELSSLERSDLQLVMRNHVLQDVVGDALAGVSEFARGRYVSLRKSFPERSVMVRIDREKIAQAIYQVLHNAVRFTKPNDEVAIDVKLVGESAEIAVEDHGPGIAEEQIPVLFEYISRNYNPEQNRSNTGVGLAIVKHILDLHSGKINVQSKQGKGSIFTLSIPGVQDISSRVP